MANPTTLKPQPFKEMLEFTVSDKIDAIVEPGWDLFFNGDLAEFAEVCRIKKS